MVPISIKILKHGDGFYDEYNFRLTLLLISSYSAYFRIWTSFISFFISSASICLIAPARRRGSAELLHPWIQKRIWIQGPLNIWKEHSNCQILSRGDSKTLKALLIPNIFLIFFWLNYFSMHTKAEGMIQFDIFHVFVENSVNSELCFFWSLFKPAKIWNLSKNAHVWAA